MSKENFQVALEHVLTYEGGYSDHPQDPGGATNLGITHDTLARYRRCSVSKDDVRNLMRDEAEAIYRSFYWDKCQCDDLPAGLDIAVFDCGVNQGCARAGRLLQHAVHETVDGIIGPKTLAAVHGCPVTQTLNEFQARRMVDYASLGIFDVFGLGWARRWKVRVRVPPNSSSKRLSRSPMPPLKR